MRSSTSSLAFRRSARRPLFLLPLLSAFAIACSSSSSSDSSQDGSPPVGQGEGGLDAPATDGADAGGGLVGGDGAVGSVDGDDAGGDSTVTEGGADSGVAEEAAVDSSASEAGGAEAGSGEGMLTSGVMAFPAPNSQGVCPDPPLRLTFSAPPTLGTAGKIQVFNAAAPGTAVASLEMGATTFSDTIGGTLFNTQRPAFIDGNDAVIYLKSQALSYGQTYYVTVDSGAIVPPTGTLSVAGTTTWRFSTVAAAPTNLASLKVALNGSGNFCSVQGAIDALPDNNATASQITINSGIYHEIVHFRSKNKVTLLGQSRTETIIEGTNNSNMNASTSTRSLVGIDASSGLVIDTMTITNLTPQGGSQAEALRLETCDECIVRNTNVNSLQDTLLWDGRLYADNCTISGNVDFVWGSGVAYFNNCIIHTVGQAGAIVQARNTASAYGYVFVDSQLTADPTVTGQVLARIDVGDFPGSQVAYVNCTMGSFISPAGWTITDGTPTSSLRFWEYQSVDTSGNPIDVSKRVAGSTQISATEAASMRDPTVVLAGWNPQ
jgi:pectin methylesterase-like acyl-CoA thioesterase